MSYRLDIVEHEDTSFVILIKTKRQWCWRYLVAATGAGAVMSSDPSAARKFSTGAEAGEYVLKHFNPL